MLGVVFVYFYHYQVDFIVEIAVYIHSQLVEFLFDLPAAQYIVDCPVLDCCSLLKLTWSFLLDLFLSLFESFKGGFLSLIDQSMRISL